MARLRRAILIKSDGTQHSNFTNRSRSRPEIGLAFKKRRLKDKTKHESHRKSKRQKKILLAWQMRQNPTPAEAIVRKSVRYNVCGFEVKSQSIILGYIADFYIPKLNLIIEVDGSFHKGREEYDQHRNQAMTRRGYSVIRFTNKEIYDNHQIVFNTIKKYATLSGHSPPLSPTGPSVTCAADTSLGSCKI